MDNNGLQSSATPSSGQVPGNSKPMWLAIGVLGAAVVALGGTLAYTQLRPAAAPAESVALASPLPFASGVEAANQPTVAPESTPVAPKVVATPKSPPKPVPRPAATAYPPRDGGQQGYSTGTAGPATPERYPVVQQPSRPVCLNCGVIDSVTAVQRAAPTNGVGAVAGGVLGAIVGNQVGHGGGRAAATVLGAVGGGYAGNAVERNVRKATVYQVRVRMEDGSVRTVEQANAPAVGARVTVDGNVIRGVDNAAYSPVPVRSDGGYATGSAY